MSTDPSAKKPDQRPTIEEAVRSRSAVRREILQELAEKARKAAATAVATGRAQAARAAEAHRARTTAAERAVGHLMPSRDPAAPSVGPEPAHIPRAPIPRGHGGMMPVTDPAAPTFGRLQREPASPVHSPALGHGGLVHSPDPAAPTFGHVQRAQAPAAPAHRPAAPPSTYVDPMAPAVYQKK